MIVVLVLVLIAVLLVVARAKSEKKEQKQPEQPKAVSANKWKGAFDAYDVAFNAIKKSPKFTLILTVAAIVGYALSVLIQGQPEAGRIQWPLEYVLLAPILLVMPAYSLAAADGKNPSFSNLYRHPLRTFVSLILAAVLAEILIVLSLVLFIIPAIWTIAWFSFAGFVVMDKNMGPIKALKESKRLAQDHIGKVWGLIGVSLLLGIAAGVIGSVPLTGPYISAALTMVFTVWASVATAVLYRWLQQNVPAEGVQSKSDTQKDTKDAKEAN